MKGNFKYVCRYFSRSSIDITPEVKNALNNRKPVIALESALITHGLPYPKNVETALEMEHIIKSHVIIINEHIIISIYFYMYTLHM